MAQIALKPQQKFHISSTGVTATDGVVSQLSDVFVIKIQKGLGVVIPGRFKLVLKLLDDASNEMGAATEFYFGYRTPDDPRRTVPIGAMNIYSPWKDLDTAQQRDDDHADRSTSATVSLRSPTLSGRLRSSSPSSRSASSGGDARGWGHEGTTGPCHPPLPIGAVHGIDEHSEHPVGDLPRLGASWIRLDDRS